MTICPNPSTRASCWPASRRSCAGSTGQKWQAGRLAGHKLAFDRWVLDTDRRTLIEADGAEVSLTTAEFRLLTVFLERPRFVLSREQLLDLTSGRASQVFDRTIDNQISRLRRKVEADPAKPALIATVWGGGYSLAADVKEIAVNTRFPFLRSLFPQSLGGQLLVMLLLALAITQGLGLLLLTDERNRAVRAALGLEAAGRAANVVLLLDNAPADLRPSILRAADSPLVRFEIGAGPEAPHDSAESDVVLRQIRQILGEPDREVRADVHALSSSSRADAGRDARRHAPDARGDDGRDEPSPLS